MKLAKDQIRFIDTYLKNSGVKYLDIRHEMTDHVATALEVMDGDFDENFRQYMLANKKNLLESNRQFSRVAGQSAMQLIAGNLMRPRFLVMAFVLFCLIYSLSEVFTPQIITEGLRGAQTLAMIAFITHYKYSGGYRHLKFSIIDKVFGIVAVFIYCVILFIRPDEWLDNPWPLILYHSLFSAFFIEILFTFRHLVRKYKLQYGS